MNLRHPAPIALVLSSLLSLAACSTTSKAPPTDPASIGEASLHHGLMRGYLPIENLPDSLALLPAPPQPGTPAFDTDELAFTSTRVLLDQPRGDLARSDARLKFPQATEAFHCAAGIPLNSDATPHLETLLRRVMTDSALSTFKAKDHYNRTRPFVYNKQASCTPEEEASLAKNGSYPSGHAALGWAWGLVLAELMPNRADALFQRAYDYGQSRVVCGVHWQSDGDAGRLMGAASVATLHTDPTFLAQMALAKQEIAALESQGTATPANCSTARSGQ